MDPKAQSLFAEALVMSCVDKSLAFFKECLLIAIIYREAITVVVNIHSLIIKAIILVAEKTAVETNLSTIRLWTEYFCFSRRFLNAL